MRIKTAELLAPTAEGFRTIVRMAYTAGRARGREEAKRQLQGLAEPPAPSATPSDSGGHSPGEVPTPETRLSEAARNWIAAAVGHNEQILA